MIVMLADHFTEICFAIIAERSFFRNNIYNRDLFPDQQSQLVALLYNGFILWIVGDAYEICTHLFYQLHISTVSFVAEALPIGI